MGSLDRLDSLDEYFMLNSPPDSPQQATRPVQQSPQEHVQAPFEMYGGYYPGAGESIIAPQGNVKLSTSNISVDRSNALERNNSLGFGRMMPSAQRDIDEMLKLDDKELNLSELFLKSTHRTSLNENYQAKGALNGHDNDLHRTRSNSLSSSMLEENERNIVNKDGESTAQNGNNAQQLRKRDSNENNKNDIALDFDLDVEPTPLSEIKAKSEQRKRMREEGEASQQRNVQRRQQEKARTGDGLTTQKLDQHQYEQQRQNRQQHSSSYYPYGRSYQLPIPTMPPNSPPGTKVANPPLSDAVATAAALASVQGTEDTIASSTRASNVTYQQQGHTPPHSPPAHPTSHPHWQNSDGSQAGNIHSNHTNPTSHSPGAASQRHHPYHHQLRNHPQTGHRSPYPGTQHHLATPLAVGTMPPGTHPVPKLVGPYTTAQQGRGNSNSRRRGSSSTSHSSTCRSGGIKKAVAASAPPASYLPRRGDHTPREASAAHTKPKGALTEAAKQRRGYSGFHKPATSQTTNTYHHPLPSKFPNYSATASSSVRPPGTQYIKNSTTAPPPPPIAKRPAPAQSKTTQPPPALPYGNGAHHRGPTAVSSNHPPADTAYERKKQRAKDARVKLNESIERLHVAMGVAGTESKKRTELLRNFMKEAGREHENNTDHQAFQLMDSCVKTAESAKKWDRPNFVGSAATLIQCLNSQCEILMRELLEYQQQAKSPAERPGRPPPLTQGKISNENDEATLPSSSNGKPQDAIGEKRRSGDQDASEKRRRLDTSGQSEDEKKEASTAAADSNSRVSPDTCATICMPLGGQPVHLEESIMDLIASFLDPRSLVKCSSVCKNFRQKSGCFLKDETWTNLCLTRFGLLKTRQWQDMQSGDDEDMGTNSVDGRKAAMGGMGLYHAMSSANVMPSFQLNGRSHTFVGHGRLPNGEASAWLFLVERSNGETMRSVKRPPGVYKSLPVVELNMVIQNTGCFARTKNDIVAINDQRLTIDASTRRKGEELFEIDFDDKFTRRLLKLNGAEYSRGDNARLRGELATLPLFDSIILVAFIHAKRCSTTTKFLQRSNFLKVLLSVNSTTQALVVPISNQVEGFN